MKTSTIIVSTLSSPSWIPLSIAFPARYGGASAAAVATSSVTLIRITWSR